MRTLIWLLALALLTPLMGCPEGDDDDSAADDPADDDDAADDCAAYDGDTACTGALPVLCVNLDGTPNPGSYTNWIDGSANIAGGVDGCQLTSRQVADSVCEQWFGPGCRMADFHDYTGGFPMTAAASFETDDRVRVAISNQVANCWQTDNDGDGVRSPEDCDDDNADSYPGAPELTERLWVHIDNQPANCWKGSSSRTSGPSGVRHRRARSRSDSRG